MLNTDHYLQLVERLSDNLLTGLASIGLNLLLALLIVRLGWKISRRAERVLDASLSRSQRIDDTLKPLLKSLLSWALKILTLALALSQIGVQMATIAAMLGAAGLAVGLALQGTLQNIAAGIMLVLLRPFQVDEYIECGSIQGTVHEIGLFNTLVERFDGIYQYVPNSQLWSGSVLNYSRNSQRRLDVPVKIDFRADTDRALALLDRFIRQHPQTLAEPAPRVMVLDVNDAFTTLNIRAWTRNDNYWDFRWDVYSKVRALLEDDGIPLAVPSYQVFAPENAAAEQPVPVPPRTKV
ncbi:mechanosensitive ion channel family protein [Crenobacter sp. SG2303]|uniref:Small-conductance mechanosensitive channel n=1 Tax=Crenobacter oryzisoli TaxID=3056844 RepID=A0ABT7XPN5_9NEIS|nr:mechanosensitive ion channel family protein [Crenobacter sp. SG2303]MDN0075768.1 mechanosensitive ion channel family protein [Crenobacter sp. SG2303]